MSPILEASNPTSLAEVTQAAESLNDPTLRTVLVSMSIVGSILLVLIGLFLLYRYAILTKLRAKLHPDLLSAPDMKSKDSGEYPTHVVVDQEPIKRFSTLSSTRSTAPPRKNSMRVSNAAAGRAIPMSTQRRSTSWMHSQSRPQGGYSWKFEKAAASNTTAIPHQKSIIMPDNTPAHTMIVTQEYLAVYLDELTLAIGDLVYPVEVYNDGWAFGTKATGEEGIFPMNHLEDVISF